MSLTGHNWETHPIVTGPDASCILGADFLQKGYFEDLKRYKWAFGVAALGNDGTSQLSTSPGLLDDPSVMGLLKMEDQKVLTASITVDGRQYQTNRDSLLPKQNLI